MRFLIPRPQFLKYIMDIINDCIWPMKFLLGIHGLQPTQAENYFLVFSL